MERLDQTKAFDALLSTLWYASLPCYDIKNVTAVRDGERAVLKYCEWKGVAISCGAIFTPNPTDQGMCCSFNLKAADDIYYDEKYAKIIADLQAADASAAFADKDKPNWYVSASEPTSIPGRKKGLFLILDAHTDQFTTTSQLNDFDGFRGLVSPSGSFPLMAQEGFEIAPGHVNAISISGIKVDADDDMKDLDVSERKCLFAHENYDLQVFKEYSYSNCIFECSLNFAMMKEP